MFLPLFMALMLGEGTENANLGLPASSSKSGNGVTDNVSEYSPAYERHVLMARAPSLAKRVSGRATWYGPGFHGQVMANGEVFDMHDPAVAASNQWPLGTRLKVSHRGRTVEVVVKDRGAFGHELDLSRAAFETLAPLGRGIIEVEIEVIPKVGED